MLVVMCVVEWWLFMRIVIIFMMWLIRVFVCFMG